MESLREMAVFIDGSWFLLEKKLSEHLYISLLSLLFALGIGVPTGIAMCRFSRLTRPLLQVANVLQTMPSLALLAILVPLLGIGLKPTIITLVAYSLLPIIQNTYVGLMDVPKGCIEAARSLGVAKWKVLIHIELPLAMPTILAGVRTSTSMIIGITTIASLIGAGGLGDFITQGLALNDPHYILLGAVPATLLALLADYTTSHLEEVFFEYRVPGENRKVFPKIIITFFALFVIYLTSTTLYRHLHKQGPPPVRIATKNFTEQLILGEIICELIESSTAIKVSRKFGLGNTAFIHSAMRRGEVDLYVEYSGTAYLNILKEKPLEKSSSRIYHNVQRAYESRYGFLWLAPLGFSNSNALAMQKSVATKYRITKISDLRHHKERFVVAAPPEFVKRADALPGLMETYGLVFSGVKSLAPDLVYKALSGEQVDVIMTFTTDGKITQNNLKILSDDRKFFPAYEAGIVIRKAMLSRYPHLKPVLDRLSGRLTLRKMRQMNLEVDAKRQTPRQVAREFVKTL